MLLLVKLLQTLPNHIVQHLNKFIFSFIHRNLCHLIELIRYIISVNSRVVTILPDIPHFTSNVISD